jgi:3-isopropylmalate/(R)-2-methylmalate dehydratase large subunit
MGSSDVAAALALGYLWFRVPATMRFRFVGERRQYTAGKDLILAVLGKIGTDGATYRCLEFGGPALEALTIDDRMALCNMAVEAGAKTCIVPVDATTRSWARDNAPGAYQEATTDPGAELECDVELDLSTIPPLIASPHSPDRVSPVGEVAGKRLDQVYIGNCANGTLTDLRQAASMLEGRRVARHVRCIVVPATQRIYLAALQEGLLDTFARAGATVSPPTCGACFGAHNGILAEGQRCLATTNRNYRGRMGDPGAEVFLANAYVAAASAVAGEIAEPESIAQ